jgi:hypothetical protein
MTSSRPVRLVVVGCGLVVERHHLPALAGLSSDVDVVGLVDPDPVRRQVCERLAPNAQPFADLRAALTECVWTAPEVELLVQICDTELPIAKAERILGYDPIPFAEGARRSGAWLRAMGFVAYGDLAAE